MSSVTARCAPGPTTASIASTISLLWISERRRNTIPAATNRPNNVASCNELYKRLTDVEIIAIGHGLVDPTLPKINWTHAAHFAAALWLMETGAGSTVSAVIRAYNESTGVANTDNSGYHETITQASMRAAGTFRNARKHLPLFRVCNDLLVSYLGRSDWLLIYWSREVLFSIEARKEWVEPDIAPCRSKRSDNEQK